MNCELPTREGFDDQNTRPEASGKTTIALHAVAESQKLGGTCVFIDAEHALDMNYAKSLGVDVAEIYITQPDSGEQALEVNDSRGDFRYVSTYLEFRV